MPGKTRRWSRADRRFMELAFAEALKVKGMTLPNPPVGAVLVKAGRVIGAGGTRPAGQAHAEIAALEQAGGRARGSTLYVTLEPCCHHGRTPPCTSALIAAGIRRVVVAARDPNPQVAGKGMRQLGRAGIVLQAGLMETEAAGLYEGFSFQIIQGRPKILLKIAQSLDGRINGRPGEETPLTGEATRTWAHGLRARVDAILIGGNTLRIDDPDLTPRLAALSSRSRSAPEVVVLSRKGPFPRESKVFSRTRPGKTIVLSRSGAGLPPWVIHEPLPSRGGEKSVIEALSALFAKRGYHSVLVEGGREVWALFLNAGFWDSLFIVTAPKVFPRGERWDAPLGRDWGKPLKFHKFAFFGEDFMVEFGNTHSKGSSTVRARPGKKSPRIS